MTRGRAAITRGFACLLLACRPHRPAGERPAVAPTVSGTAATPSESAGSAAPIASASAPRPARRRLRDIDGDGRADVLVARGDAHDGTPAAVERWSLDSQGPRRVEALLDPTRSPRSDGWAWSVAMPGDLDGDGLDDVVATRWRSEMGTTCGSGSVHVYLGRRAGLAARPDQSLAPAEALSAFGSAVYPAGDVNGDGLADVLVEVGAREPSGGSLAPRGRFVSRVPWNACTRRRVALYLGARGGLAPAPAGFVEAVNAETASHAVLDVDRDGRSELVVPAVVDAPAPVGDVGSQRLELRLYRGGERGYEATASQSIALGPAEDRLLALVPGDYDGDGREEIAALRHVRRDDRSFFLDLVLVDPRAPADASGVSGVRTTVFYEDPMVSDAALATSADLDGDGRDELFVATAREGVLQVFERSSDAPVFAPPSPRRIRDGSLHGTIALANAGRSAGASADTLLATVPVPAGSDPSAMRTVVRLVNARVAVGEPFAAASPWLETHGSAIAGLATATSTVRAAEWQITDEARARECEPGEAPTLTRRPATFEGRQRSPAAFHAAFSHVHAPIVACMTRALGRACVFGDLELRATVDASGVVTHAEVPALPAALASARTCIEDELRRMHVAETEQPGTQTVTLSFFVDR